MNLKKLVLGSHLFYCREGVVVGGVTSGQYAKPALANPAPVAPAWDPNWPPIGRVQDISITPKVVEQDVMTPEPGAYVLSDVVPLSKTLNLSFDLFEVSELFFEGLMLSSGPIATATADAPNSVYQPLSGSGQLRGWLKAQQYDQTNAARNVFDVYIVATVKALKMENKLIIGQMDAKVLYSPLNSGVLSLA